MIHVPKTGGTWCRTAIKAAGISYFESGPAHFPTRVSRIHAAFRHARDTIMVKNWEKKKQQHVRRFVFGFVRHPLTWLESAWADALERGKTPGYKPSLKKPWFWFHRCYAWDFTELIDNVIKLKIDVPSRAMLARLGYHTIDGIRWYPDEHTLDFIGRNENLIDDFVHALRFADEQFDERRIRAVKPQRVSSRLAKYKDKLVWRSDQRKAIYEANRQLFDDFGYTI